MKRLTASRGGALGSSCFCHKHALPKWPGSLQQRLSSTLSGSQLLEAIRESRTQRKMPPFLATAKKGLVDTIAFKVSAMGITPTPVVWHRNNDLYCLFVSDEVDNLHSSTAQREERLRILHELAHLGNSDDGRVVSIVCGSSSVLPLLLSKNIIKYPRIAEDFPLVTDAPNLNCSKRFANFAAMAAAFRVPEQHLNLFYFLAGNNSISRSLNRLLVAAKHRRHNELLEYLDEWDTRAEFTQLNNELIKKNQAVLKDLYHMPSSDEYKAIQTTNWLSKLEPLTVEELTETLLPRLNSRKEIDLYNRWSTPDVLALVDKGWFASSPKLTRLHPRTGYQLYQQFVSSFSYSQPGTKLWQVCNNPEFRSLLVSGLISFGQRVWPLS
ncbi:hypothetical protein QOT17_008351 [Balamuthia mandrillaris]